MKDAIGDWDESLSQREFQAILALSQESSYIVQIYEVLRESDSKLYFVCEFMPDGTLNDFLTRIRKKGRSVEPSLVRSIVRQVLLGVQHIHSRG
jgi:serine/threonine protein kinase